MESNKHEVKKVFKLKTPTQKKDDHTRRSSIFSLKRMIVYLITKHDATNYYNNKLMAARVKTEEALFHPCGAVYPKN